MFFVDIAKVLKIVILQNFCERLLLNFFDIFFKSALEMFQCVMDLINLMDLTDITISPSDNTPNTTNFL